MESKYKLEVTLPSDTEIKQVRAFDAPRDLVFKALTDPQILMQWWGPHGYTTTIDKLDFRLGGGWRFVQIDPEGNQHAFRGEFREIEPPQRVVQTFEYEPMAGHIAVEEMTLEEQGGVTTLTTISTFSSKEDRDGMLQSGAEQGASESMDRLEAILAALAAE